MTLELFKTKRKVFESIKMIKCERNFESVDEATLLSEPSVGLIAGPVGPLISTSARITVHGCTVYANVILAVLTLHLRHHRNHRK